MWSDITIRCKHDLPREVARRLESRFGRKADPFGAIGETVLKDRASPIAHLVIYSQVTASRVFIVFLPESRTLSIHVESIARKNSLRSLKRELEGLIGEVEDFLKLEHNKSKEVQIVIWGDDEILNGKSIGFMTRVKEAFLDDILAKVLIPAVTWAVSAMMSLPTAQSLLNTLVALLSLLLLTVTKSFKSSKLEYKEV